MGAALISATQINFKYEEIPEDTPTQKAPPPMTYEDQMQAQLAEQLQLPSLADTRAATADIQPQKKSEEKVCGIV